MGLEAFQLNDLLYVIAGVFMLIAGFSGGMHR